MQLLLLGGMEIHCGLQRYRLPLGAQRLLALLALHDGGIHRVTAAERLWPDSRRSRAPANLRSALWKAGRIGGIALIESSGPRIQLTPHVQIDLRTVRDAAHRICAAAEGRADLRTSAHVGAARSVVTALSRELLPDWSDEWLLLERERWDQIRMHALETIAHQMMDEQQYLPALEAAFAAVAIEPVRESAHRAVIEIYIAEGNAASALKHYLRYRGLLHRELGVTPSAQMTRLVQPLTAL